MGLRKSGDCGRGTTSAARLTQKDVKFMNMNEPPPLALAVAVAVPQTVPSPPTLRFTWGMETPKLGQMSLIHQIRTCKREANHALTAGATRIGAGRGTSEYALPQATPTFGADSKLQRRLRLLLGHMHIHVHIHIHIYSHSRSHIHIRLQPVC